MTKQNKENFGFGQVELMSEGMLRCLRTGQALSTLFAVVMQTSIDYKFMINQELKNIIYLQSR